MLLQCCVSEEGAAVPCGRSNHLGDPSAGCVCVRARGSAVGRGGSQPAVRLCADPGMMVLCAIREGEPEFLSSGVEHLLLCL